MSFGISEYRLSTTLALAVVVMFGMVSTAAAQTEVTLHSFGSGTDGLSPSGLVSDRDGNLYGVTSEGGAYGFGTLYKLDRDGNETVLYSFSDEAYPSTGLTIDRDRNLYGTTAYGGAYGFGFVFKVDKNGDETVVYSFPAAEVAAISSHPSRLTLDRDGNLYGTTLQGGALGVGTVFKLDPSGNMTLLYTFQGFVATPADGATPTGGVALDREGNIYGTTVSGGASEEGTVFKLDPNGNETILHSFLGGSDGTQPTGGVILDREGNIYGTTSTGGSSTCGVGGDGCGIVFKLTPSGDYAVLHAFAGSPDGASPGGAFGDTFSGGGLVLDRDGNLYGTTYVGGATSAACPYYPSLNDSGCGTVFKLSPNGDETVVYSFLNSPDGAYPAGAILDREGNIYGTTSSGGASGYGTVFKIRRRFNARDPQVFPPIQ